MKNVSACYEAFKLESYIGAPILNELFGTINFSSSKPKENGFVRVDEDFIKLLAEWIANILKHTEIEQALQEKEEMYRLISVNSADMICLYDQDG